MHCRKDFLDLTPLELNRLGIALNDLWDLNRFQIYGPLHEDGWFSMPIQAIIETVIAGMSDATSKKNTDCSASPVNQGGTARP